MNLSEPRAPGVAPHEKPKRTLLRRALMLFAKLGVAALAFAYVFTRQSWPELAAAIRGINPVAVAAVAGIFTVCLSLGAVRWALLMRAYGAAAMPAFTSMLRVYFVGHFYNTYLPGAVGGDVLRGIVTRGAFPDGGATSSVAIVLVERSLGVLAILSLTTLAIPLDVEGTLARSFLPFALMGIAGVVAALFGLAHAHRLAAYLPRRIAPHARSLPQLVKPGYFALACLISIGIQSLVVISGHLLVSSLFPAVRFSDSLLVMPLSAAAAYFPLSVAGAGPRDAVLVSLYGLLGVPKAVAVATALTLLVLQLLVAALGGIWQLLAPLDLERQTRS